MSAINRFETPPPKAARHPTTPPPLIPRSVVDEQEPWTPVVDPRPVNESLTNQARPVRAQSLRQRRHMTEGVPDQRRQRPHMTEGVQDNTRRREVIPPRPLIRDTAADWSAVFNMFGVVDFQPNFGDTAADWSAVFNMLGLADSQPNFGQIEGAVEQIEPFGGQGHRIFLDPKEEHWPGKPMKLPEIQQTLSTNGTSVINDEHTTNGTE